MILAQRISSLVLNSLTRLHRSLYDSEVVEEEEGVYTILFFERGEEEREVGIFESLSERTMKKLQSFGFPRKNPILFRPSALKIDYSGEELYSDQYYVISSSQLAQNYQAEGHRYVPDPGESYDLAKEMLVTSIVPLVREMRREYCFVKAEYSTLYRFDDHEHRILGEVAERYRRILGERRLEILTSRSNRSGALAITELQDLLCTEALAWTACVSESDMDPLLQRLLRIISH